MEKNKFKKLKDIIAHLRGPEGCAWDKLQTPHTMLPYIIEEAYEIVDAVENNDYDSLKEELGDLLLHILFYSEMMKDYKLFDIDDVIDGISAKLIARHPHIFGDEEVSSVSEILQNWENVKQKLNGNKSIIDGLPSHLPALILAQRIQEKVSRIGFDWKDKMDVWNKIEEEFGELNEAVLNDDIDQIEEELGDLFFILTNFARFYHLSSEFVLKKSVRKFSKRFKYVEKMLKEKDFKNPTLEQMDEFWDEAKSSEKG